MAIIEENEKNRLLALGVEGFSREIADGKHCEPTSPYRDAADALLRSMQASEDAAAAIRAERRDALLDRRDAYTLKMAIWANVIAIIAIVIAMKDQILTLIFGSQP